MISLIQEPDNLLPIFTVRSSPKLSHPVGGGEVVTSLRHVGLDGLHGGLEQVVGQVRDDRGEGVDGGGGGGLEQYLGPDT